MGLQRKGLILNALSKVPSAKTQEGLSLSYLFPALYIASKSIELLSSVYYVLGKVVQKSGDCWLCLQNSIPHISQECHFEDKFL